MGNFLALELRLSFEREQTWDNGGQMIGQNLEENSDQILPSFKMAFLLVVGNGLEAIPIRKLLVKG